MPSITSTSGQSEPAQAVQHFWSTIRQADHEAISEATRQILLRACPSVETFSFDMVDDVTGDDEGRPPALSVEAGTPKPVVKSWNDNKLVGLQLVKKDVICGAAIGNDTAPSARDFKACALPLRGDEGVRCGSGTHVGHRLKRMNPPVGDFLLAIPVPTGDGVVKNLFSRPVLEEMDLYFLPEASPEFVKLLTYRMEPRVWKTLFELFPGAECMDPTSRGSSKPLLSTPSAPRRSSEVESVTSDPITTPRGKPVISPGPRSGMAGQM